MPRIVVVGAGDCGTRAALAVREQGWEGEIVLVGDEPTPPYERPLLSKTVLTDPTIEPPVIRSPQALAAEGIELRAGRPAVALDRDERRLALEGGDVLAYDRLLLATGSRALRPALPRSAEAVVTLRSRADAHALRELLRDLPRLFIIGGGFIGLEVAAAANSLGCDVTLAEFAHRLMSRVVPEAVAERIRVRHLEAGVDLRCGVAVRSLEERKGAFEITLTDGTRSVADLVVAGVGAMPNSELAAAAGLAIENGIQVDERLRTSDPAVFAAGDCCSIPHPLYGGRRVRLEAWRGALEQAAVAAANLAASDLAAGDAIYNAVPWFWSDQYELGIQIAGLHAAAVHDVVRARDDGAELRFGLDHDGRVVAASGVAEGSSIGRDISLAETLIARRATPNPALLANPAVDLRELVRSAVGA